MYSKVQIIKANEITSASFILISSQSYILGGWVSTNLVNKTYDFVYLAGFFICKSYFWENFLWYCEGVSPNCFLKHSEK